MIIHNLVNKAFRFADRVVGRLFGSYVSERQKLQDGTVKEHYGPRAHLHWQNLNDNERGKPKGVPYEGKGENSWDCGEDGIFGIGTDKPSYPALIARVVEHVLSQRKKRDGNMDAKYPDPAIRKASFEKRRAEAKAKRLRGEDQPMCEA